MKSRIRNFFGSNKVATGVTVVRGICFGAVSAFLFWTVLAKHALLASAFLFATITLVNR